MINLLNQINKEIAAAISCVSNIITSQINSPSRDNELLKSLMDAVRILCDIQYFQSTSRRNLALANVKKDLKEQLQKSKIDNYLFGSNLTETIKTAKAVSRSSIDLKADSTKKPKQGKNLNRKSGTGYRRAAPGPQTFQPPLQAPSTTAYQPSPPLPPAAKTRAYSSNTSRYQPRQTRRR